MSGGKFLRPESRRAVGRRRKRQAQVWAWLVLGNAALLAAQLLGWAHPVFTSLLMAALSGHAGFRLGLER